MRCASPARACICTARRWRALDARWDISRPLETRPPKHSIGYAPRLHGSTARDSFRKTIIGVLMSVARTLFALALLGVSACGLWHRAKPPVVMNASAILLNTAGVEVGRATLATTASGVLVSGTV